MVTRGGPLLFTNSRPWPIRRTLAAVSHLRLVAAVALLAACPAYPVLDTTETGAETSSATTANATSGLPATSIPTTGETPSSTTGATTTGETTTGGTTTGETTTSETSAATTGKTSSTTEAGSSTGDQGTCPDPNSHEIDGQCFCNEDYDWCAPDDLRDLSCCLEGPSMTTSGSSGSSSGTTG